ncbi:MAG: hypothetical protein AAGJ29_13000 [Pseudomonadota bacterium]
MGNGDLISAFPLVNYIWRRDYAALSNPQAVAYADGMRLPTVLSYWAAWVFALALIYVVFIGPGAPQRPIVALNYESSHPQRRKSGIAFHIIYFVPLCPWVDSIFPDRTIELRPDKDHTIFRLRRMHTSIAQYTSPTPPDEPDAEYRKPGQNPPHHRRVSAKLRVIPHGDHAKSCTDCPNNAEGEYLLHSVPRLFMKES